VGCGIARRISDKKLSDIAHYLYAADGAEYCRSCRGLCLQRGATCVKPQVYLPNLNTVRVFLNLNWDHGPMGHPTGIRPGDIRELIWLLNIPEIEKTGIFSGVRIMESTALALMRQREQQPPASN
jgi:hypothetical protein